MNKVYIIFDCSGSMSEYGRRAVIKNAFMAVRQRYSRVEMYRWNDTIESIEKAKNIVTRGSVNVKAFTEFINKIDGKASVLLVSDGCWSTKDTESISSAAEGSAIYTCSLGQDANLAALSKVQTIGKKCFRMVDFPMALEHLLRR